jgi:fatty acid desaturase
MKSWAAGQVEHSMNFAQSSQFAFYLSFGLNFQIEHHLFPGISHDHYEAIAPKIEDVCKKHNVEYWTEPSLTKAMGILYKAVVDLKERAPVNFDEKK